MTIPKIALDAHTHLIPIDEDRLRAIDGVSWNAATGRLTVDGHVIGIASLYHPQDLRAWMAGNAVDHAWISIPPPLYRQHLRGAEAQAWTSYVNDGLDRLAREAGGAFTALVHLPTENPALAAATARQWLAKDHRLFAMCTGTGDDRGLDAAEFDPLWATLDEARAFVLLHPGEAVDGRLQSFYLTNLLGNPYESTVALARLVLGGVLSRHRRFTPCIAHGGGLFPMVAGRLDRGFETERPGIRPEHGRPSDALGRVHADCICHGEDALILSEKTFGAGNVIFGSDWPFPMGLVEPGTQLASYRKERLERIQICNAGRLLSQFTAPHRRTP